MSTTPQSQTGVKAESVLEARVPAFSTREAEAIARRAFDIHASAHRLDSERDQNLFRRDDPRYADRYAACYAACIDDAVASLAAAGFAPTAFST